MLVKLYKRLFVQSVAPIQQIVVGVYIDTVEKRGQIAVLVVYVEKGASYLGISVFNPLPNPFLL